MTSARALLRHQLRVAHDRLEGAARPLGGEAARRYADVLLAEDLIVNGVLAGGQPLSLTTWAGRTGARESDLSRLHGYARAVRAATDAYLAGLPEGALDPADLCLLTALVLDLAARRGEIDCLLRR